MSCPAWEKCQKKYCIEQSVCMGEYWVNYWKNKVLVAKQSQKVVEKISKETPCSKVKGICDKQATCEFLGQCIFTISAVKGNKKVIKSLSGRHTMKEVLVVLAELNPKPMRSYYLHSKKKK